MMFWYFLVVVALLWLVFATITDIKSREVLDWLNYSLIAIGFGSRLIYSFITKDFSYVIYGIVGFVIFFAFANFMYFTKQWGGGDSKLLMGLGVMFGNYNSFLGGIHKLPFLVTLLLNIFIAGTVYGVLYSLFLGVKNWNKFLIELKKRSFIELKIISCLIVILSVVSFLIFDKSLAYLIILLLVLLFFGFTTLYIIRIVEDVLMYKMLEISKLTEGDWLVNDIFKGKSLICKARNIGLTKEDISKLKKNKIKRVLVKEGIPFVPGFLIGFLISVIFGDFIFLFA